VLPSTFKEKLALLAEKFGLAEIYAYGSRSKETAAKLRDMRFFSVNPRSDLDIGVRLKPEVSLEYSERVQLTLELEDLMNVPRVDLVILQEAEPFLALEVVRGEIMYAQDMDSQARYELYILRRAGDLFPYKKERLRMILEEGAR
jgi:predicted nucleotidyltransferase